MLYQRFIFFALTCFTLFACNTSHQSIKNPQTAHSSFSIENNSKYHGSATKYFDLIHTKLEVSFDWDNKQLDGTAEITLKPHFYNVGELGLNARSFFVKEVNLIKGEVKEEVGYIYKNDSIIITLDKQYTRNDTIKVYIKYTANPEAISKGGSAAITNDKGLYFINAGGEDPLKPKQIWTQGETQSSSAWFPTIDSPNQKTTQEIYITVDTTYVTLSNGTLVSSIVNSYNGTRTDYWKQDQPHSPYLFMMAIGEYAVVKDKWRGKEVSYYVEPEYEPYARNIFAHTPEMLEFFSEKLGVPYPWEKYAQVVVRDYVSGAMENTSATVYGEFMQKDNRALLDASNDDIIAHELFHQWFGDLVTMESWSNLTLNEGFASYGEYLWNEYKYGRDEADYNLENDLRSYLREARNKKVDLIRFHYDDHMDMFDRHSYQKGARVLHMLRKHVGDEAFYAALNLYLNNHIFGNVEVHDLRLAFEKITGEDLNWFFNQWFLDKGHPDLKIDYNYDSENGVQYVHVKQKQLNDGIRLFIIPVKIDVYTNTGVQRYDVTVNQPDQTFAFNVPSKPLLVNFDAEKMLVCTKEDNHSHDEFIELYNRGPLYLDRYEALTALATAYKPGSPEAMVVKNALDDSFRDIRSQAIDHCKGLVNSDKEFLKQKLISIVNSDPKPSVRTNAINKLAEIYGNDTIVNKTILNAALHDSSYAVVETAVSQITLLNPESGLTLIKALEKDNNEHVRTIVAAFYADFGNDNQYEFMTNAMLNNTGYSAFTSVQYYGDFLMKCSPKFALEGVEKLAEVGENHDQWFVRVTAAAMLAKLNKSYGEDELKALNNSQNNKSAVYNHTEFEIKKVRTKAAELLYYIKEKETNADALKIYNQR